MSRYGEPTLLEVIKLAKTTAAIFANAGLSVCFVGITAQDPKYFLVASKDPSATYRVLWYTISPPSMRACKVDILLPGIMNIPDVSRKRIIMRNGLPLMPMLPLLFLKLQAWTDHRAASKHYMRVKQYVDERDIFALVKIVAAHGAKLHKEDWLPKAFVLAAKERVAQYILHYPSSERGLARHWV